MDDPHSDCPTLGQLAPADYTAALASCRGAREQADRMLDALLAQAADAGTPLRRMRPVPRSTAAYRIARHRRAAGTEAAA